VSRFEQVAQAVADIAAGRPVVLCDGADGGHEGDLVFAAATASPQSVAFMVRHTSGYVGVALTGEACDRLGLPPMCRANTGARRTAYTVTVDARTGISTGISGADRSRTLRLLADPATVVADLTRPGHVVPLRAEQGGVLYRRGRAEAAVDLARLAGLAPAGALCEIVSAVDPGGMARGEELRAFAAEHGLQLITIADLVAYRRRVEQLLTREAEARMPTPHGAFRAVGYDCPTDGAEHLALVAGDHGALHEDVLVAVHSECLLGDVLGSLHCGCGPRLDSALASVAAEGRGVVLYLRSPGRRTDRHGTGPLGGLRAGFGQAGATHDDVVNDPDVVAQILTDLGVRSLRLLGDDPATSAELTSRGLRVTARVPPIGQGDPGNLVRLPATPPALLPIAIGTI
jgi:3,4-dihydroxy 2-butanone 4-phosphate synthase/GTP cyclohydrolase II